MKKFIVIYHAPVSATNQTANLSAEDQAKGMEGWMKWAEKCGSALVDMGAPLANGQQLQQGDKSISSNRDVTGYSILEAENMEAAKKLLQGHPHLGWNPECTIELHETMPLPGM